MGLMMVLQDTRDNCQNDEMRRFAGSTCTPMTRNEAVVPRAMLEHTFVYKNLDSQQMTTEGLGVRNACLGLLLPRINTGTPY